MKLSLLQKRYDRYYLKNCKPITFEKFANHTKYKKSNLPSHLQIF